MIEKVNLLKSADSAQELFKYLKVGQLNDHMRYDGESITGPDYLEADAEIFKYVAKHLSARVQRG